MRGVHSEMSAVLIVHFQVAIYLHCLSSNQRVCLVSPGHDHALHGVDMFEFIQCKSSHKAWHLFLQKLLNRIHAADQDLVLGVGHQL